MEKQQLEKLLGAFAETTAEPPPVGLCEDIKHHVPRQLSRRRHGMDSVNIIIDLRVGRLTAAAAIIVTLVLFANLFGRRYLGEDGILRDTEMAVKYFIGGSQAVRSDVSVDVLNLYQNLLQQGKDVVYYGRPAAIQGKDAILMHWRLSDGNYVIVYGDFSSRTVTADELVFLQAQMLQKKCR